MLFLPDKDVPFRLRYINRISDGLTRIKIKYPSAETEDHASEYGQYSLNYGFANDSETLRRESVGSSPSIVAMEHGAGGLKVPKLEKTQ